MPTLNSPQDGTVNDPDKKLDQIVEDANKDNAGGDNSKKEDQVVNPFQEELDRLKAEVDKKNEIIDHKNRAIDALKKKDPVTDPAPAGDEELIEVNGVFYKKKDAEAIMSLAERAVSPKMQEQLKNLEAQIVGSKIDQVLETMTSDPAERELIKFHLENTVKPSGNLAEDLKRARLLANEKIIYNEGMNAGLEAKREEFLTQFTPSSSSSKGGSQKFSDPSLQLAADMLEKAGLGEVVKHLQK